MNYIVAPETARKALDDKGLKIAWVAKKIGVQPDTLGKFLSGRNTMGRPAQILLCQVLGLERAS